MARKHKKRPFFIYIIVLFITLLAAFLTSQLLFKYLGFKDEKTVMAETKKSVDNATQKTRFKNSLHGLDTLVYEVWNKRIDQVGPAQAYKEFKQNYQNSNTNDAHTASHIFG